MRRQSSTGATSSVRLSLAFAALLTGCDQRAETAGASVAQASSAAPRANPWEAREVRWVGRVQLEESSAVVNVRPVVRRDPRGGYLIADVSEAQVRRYGEHGDLLWYLGRRGRGPNEFQSPRAITRLPSGEILVADVPGRLVLLDSAGMEVTRTLALQIQRTEDLDALNDSLVLVGGIVGSVFESGMTPDTYVAGPRLHVVDLRGERVVESFFRPFEDHDVDIAAMAGSVVFAVAHGRIAVAALPRDTVYFFDQRGRELDRIPLPSDSFRVIERLDPADFRDPQKRQAWLESFDGVTGIEWIDTETLVVEYRRLVGRKMQWNLVVMTRDGERLLEWMDAPRLRTVTAGGVLVLQDPNSATPDRWALARLPS